MTKQKIRNRKEKRWTRAFTEAEERDRNNRNLYERMPSPLGSNWLDYIHHRVKMMESGIAVYTTEKYTRLKYEKHIESNRACDNIAGMLTNHQATLVHMGGAAVAADSPIGIKKGLRCPGNRKMIRSYKKCPGCFINMVDEYYTSQTCGKCYSRFDRRTKRDRYKVCIDCRPYPNEMIIPLPSMIVTTKSKRMRSLINFLMEKEEEEANDEGHQSGGEVAHPNQSNTESLLPKVEIYHKIWQVNPVSGTLEYVNAKRPIDDADDVEMMEFNEYRPHKTVWHRDIVAARCILIKGTIYKLY